MSPLTIVCWKWKPHPGGWLKKQSPFSAQHVNVLFAMVKRHLHIPFRFVCITDEPDGIDQDVIIHPIWDLHKRIGACYRRLKAFDSYENIGHIFGERYVSIDLDCVIMDNITPLFDRPEEFIIWGSNERRTPYCGAMWLLKTGERYRVWERFHPVKSISDAKSNGFRTGSDQAHICNCLYPNEAMWDDRDGIHNFKLEIRTPDPKFFAKLYRHRKMKLPAYAAAVKDFRRRVDELHKHPRHPAAHRPVGDHHSILLNQPTGYPPAGAKIVFFNGRWDPSDSDVQVGYPWIKEHYHE